MLIKTVCLLILWTFPCITGAESDLYDILEVERSADTREIKKAYKNLAKQWHPDKRQDDPDADQKFMKINEAYETLSDPDKRDEYDRFGRTTGQSAGQRRGNHFDDGFEQFFTRGGFRFNFHDGMDGKYRQTLRSWQNKIIPESHKKPYVLYAYSDFCFSCMQIEPIWDKFTSDLEDIGMGIGTVNLDLDRPLGRQIGVSNVPKIFAVIDGKIKYYRGSHYRVKDLREFLRGLFSKQLVTTINNDNVQEFLSGWQDNRPRALFFSSKASPTLRAVLSAYAFKERIAFGYVTTLASDCSEVVANFSVKTTDETLLVFNESPRPIASVSMAHLSRPAIDNILEANQYLILPRLSSSKMLKELCPPEKRKMKRKLCVVLFTESSESHNQHRNEFRQFSTQNVNKRLHFTYLYEDRQTKFLDRLSKNDAFPVTESSLKVAFLWRPNEQLIHYGWSPDGWDLNHLQKSKDSLSQSINSILRDERNLSMVIQWMELYDENQSHLLMRIFNRIVEWTDSFYHYFNSYDLVSVITIVVSCLVMLSALYFIQGMLGNVIERENVSEPPRPQNPMWNQQTLQRQNLNTPVLLKELTFVTFDEHIIDLPRGIITVVLLTNDETREKLLEQYAGILQPYTLSKYFKFSFMRLESYAFWYEHLLEETIGYKRSLSINPSNCVGTVLAINGYRKYYCVFHTMHRDSKKEKTAEFMGFDDSDSSEDSYDFLTDEIQNPVALDIDLLKGLANWMDRFVEGSLRRFKVDRWPEMASL